MLATTSTTTTTTTTDHSNVGNNTNTNDDDEDDDDDNNHWTDKHGGSLIGTINFLSDDGAREQQAERKEAKGKGQ